RRRGLRCNTRPVGQRKNNPAGPARGARFAEPRLCAHRRHRSHSAQRGRACPLPPRRRRLRVPVVPADSVADGPRERAGTARAARRPGRRQAGRGAARPGRPRRPARSLSRAAFGRRAAAGRARPRVRQRASHPIRRRADRQSRRRHRRGDHPSARGAEPRARHDARAGHARSEPRRPRAPHDPSRGRRDRLGYRSRRMTARRLLSLALRESRFSRRRLFLFLSAISLGVAALVAVQGFASTMQREVREQARAMLGADMQLSSREPFGPRSSELLDEFAAEGIAVARVTSFASMARHTGSGATRLVQVRAIEPGFPFYGTIETNPPGRWQALHDGRNAVVDPALLVALDAEVGDTISIGETELTVTGALDRLPGDIEIASSFAPRVFMPAAYVDETELLGFGSRAEYEAFLRVENPELAELIDDQYRPVWRAERVRSRT